MNLPARYQVPITSPRSRRRNLNPRHPQQVGSPETARFHPKSLPDGKGGHGERPLTLSAGFVPKKEAPGAPRTALEALEQRMERYRAAAAQAKGKGDERKARMHERIVKVGPN